MTHLRRGLAAWGILVSLLLSYASSSCTYGWCDPLTKTEAATVLIPVTLVIVGYELRLSIEVSR